MADSRENEAPGRGGQREGPQDHGLAAGWRALLCGLLGASAALEFAQQASAQLRIVYVRSGGSVGWKQIVPYAPDFNFGPSILASAQRY